MRFHISFNLKTIKKLLIPLGIAIAIYFGLNSMTVYAVDTSINLQPRSITINVNNQNLSYAPELNTGWAGYNVYTYSSNVGIDWETANIIYTYNNISNYKFCTQSNGVATVQGKFIAGLGSLGGGVEYINEISGNVSTCSFKMEGIIGTFTCNNVHLNSDFSFVNISNPGSRLGITQSLDITCGEMTTGQAVDNIINNDNKNTQDIINNNKENTDKIVESQKETYDYLSDDTPPESDISALGNVQGLLPPGPVDSLLNIPFKFLSVINSSFGGVCVPLTGEFVYDSTLTLPCFSEMFYDEVPPLLLNFLSLIPASFILIKYLKHLYKKVDRAVSMETTADDEWGVL